MTAKTGCAALMCVFLSLSLARAQAPQPQAAADNNIDRIAAKEAENVKALAGYSPLVETYAQTYRADEQLGRVPNGDHYFLGRASFRGRVSDVNFLPDEHLSAIAQMKRQLTEFGIHHQPAWVPAGFAQMVVVDADGFNRERYDFRFQRPEFLGDIRCLVFDVVPRHGRGRFLGRIWVEDRDFNVVRFNGIQTKPREHAAYIHFDSWRVNAAGRWLPAYIYGEETSIKIAGKLTSLRSQTRLWDFGREGVQAEITAVKVDSEYTINDLSGDGPLSPVASQRAWEREAETNALDRLERAGLLAPPSDVDKLLATVVNNLIVTNELIIDPEVRCRVLLTTPVESFAIGHTIVISRGLLDVLPDEASLAVILAGELSHVLLGHSIDTKFAFNDRLLVRDDQTLSLFAMPPTEDQPEVDKKTINILLKSPYQSKLGGMALFMAQLRASSESVPNLVRSRIGKSLLESPQLATILADTPKLDPKNLQQVAALPLGARIELDPWTNRIAVAKAKSVPLLNSREKMPFEIVPLRPYLTRSPANAPAAAKLSNGGQ